jgi:hypothetical protein
LNFLISYSIAQTAQRPTWNKGDLFGAAGKWCITPQTYYRNKAF